MIIVDTSVWIEFFRGHAPYFDHMGRLFESREVLALPWIFGELLQGARNNSEINILKRTFESLPKPELALAERAWILAGAESFRGKWHSKGVGLIDAAICVVAHDLGLKVWTLDKKLESILKFKRLLYVA